MRFGQNWELENGKIRVLAIQKVVETGNILGKKLQWQAILVMQDTSASRTLT